LDSKYWQENKLFWQTIRRLRGKRSQTPRYQNSVLLNNEENFLIGGYRRRRRLPLVSEHGIRLLSGLRHLWLMTIADVTLKAQPVME